MSADVVEQTTNSNTNLSTLFVSQLLLQLKEEAPQDTVSNHSDFVAWRCDGSYAMVSTDILVYIESRLSPIPLLPVFEVNLKVITCLACY